MTTSTPGVDLIRVIGKAAPPLCIAFSTFLAITVPGPGALAAGALSALAPALYGLVFGVSALTAALPPAALRAGAALALIAAALAGFAGPFEGAGAFAPPADAEHGGLLIDAFLRGAAVLGAACLATLAFMSLAGRAADLAESNEP